MSNRFELGEIMELDDINLCDPGNFVASVPHDWFAFLRREAPVQWHPDPEGFSSYRAATLFHDFDDDILGQQRMMMLNMDPPMHTRYRRLVNKGFTPRMIRDLEAKVIASTDSILDSVCEQGSADFVEQIAAELPLQVIAELMGVSQEDRHLVFDWSNRMVGSDDPEYQISPESSTQASMELFAYADELCAKKRIDPHEDLFSVLTQAEIDGDQLSQLELDLFCDALISIAEEIETDPQVVLHAPHLTRTSRVDEVAAARKPVVRWKR